MWRGSRLKSTRHDGGQRGVPMVKGGHTAYQQVVVGIANEVVGTTAADQEVAS